MSAHPDDLAAGLARCRDCWHCGTPVDLDTEVCPHCGALEPAGEPPAVAVAAPATTPQFKLADLRDDAPLAITDAYQLLINELDRLTSLTEADTAYLASRGVPMAGLIDDHRHVVLVLTGLRHLYGKDQAP